MIPQHFPLYLREADKPPEQARRWLVVGWVPDRDSGLPRQPVVILCGAAVQEPILLEKTTFVQLDGIPAHQVTAGPAPGPAAATRPARAG